MILRKVRAHLTLFASILGVISFYELVGNRVADEIAKQFAAHLSLPEQVVEGVLEARTHTTRILRRLVEANLVYIDLVRQLSKDSQDIADAIDASRVFPAKVPRVRNWQTHDLKQVGGHWQCTQCGQAHVDNANHRWAFRCPALPSVDVDAAGLVNKRIADDMQVASGNVTQVLKRRRLNHKQPASQLYSTRAGSSSCDNGQAVTLKLPFHVHAPVLGPFLWGQIATLWQQFSPPPFLPCVQDHLKFGNVRIHFTHLLTLHHVGGESLLYCPTCMGTSRGFHAVRLSSPCKSPLTPSLRAARRRLYDGKWPTVQLEASYQKAGIVGRSNRYSVFLLKRQNTVKTCSPYVSNSWLFLHRFHARV